MKVTSTFRSTIYIFFAGILFLLISESILFGQDKSVIQLRDITGTVRDLATGESLIYANIIIKNSDYGATTNLRGYFVIPDIPAEKCTLSVSYLGYKTKEIAFDNSIEQQTELIILLEPTSIITKDVNVVADKYNVWKTAENVSQITVSPKQLASLPNLGEVDIFRSLQLLPGISGINDGSSGLYVRGGTPDQNLILLDGMTVYHVDHFFGFFSAFNSDAVKDVQVYKGGFPAKYGGRLSSVVDLTGKTGNINEFSMSLGANLLSANTIMEIPLFGKGSVLISARRSYADIISSSTYDNIYNFLTGSDNNEQPSRRGMFNQVEEEILPSFYFYDLNAKISYQVSKSDFIALSLYNGEDYLDESQSEQGGMQRAFGSALTGERINEDATNWGNLGLSLKWSRQWSNRFYSNILFAASDYFNERNRKQGFNFPGGADSINFTSRNFGSSEENNVTDYTFHFDNEMKLSQNNNLSFGILYSDISANFLMEFNDSLRVIDRKSSSLSTAFYIQDEYEPFTNLRLSGGLRLTYYNPTKITYTEPRASAQYRFWGDFKISASWGKFYQFVNHISNEDVLEGTRDFWLVADDNLKPSESDHYILGVSLDTEDYLFSIEGYYKDLSNLVEFTQRASNNPRLGTNSNIENNFFTGSGISKGVEFLVQKKFGSLNGWVSYTLGKVDYKFPGINDNEVFPADHDRRHEVKLISTYEIGSWNFSSTWVFASGKAYTAPISQYSLELLDGEEVSYIHVSGKNENRLPDYHRLDLSATYKFKNRSFKGDVGLSIFNVYNNKNVWYRQYDLDVSPIVITDVSMLGITPTVFFKLYF